MRRLIFPLVDKYGKLAVHGLALFSWVFVPFEGTFGVRFREGRIWLRSGWRENRLASCCVWGGGENGSGVQ